MDPKFEFLLLLLGFLCFVFSTGFPGPAEGRTWRGWRFDLVPLGLAFWIFVPLWVAWKAL